MAGSITSSALSSDLAPSSASGYLEAELMCVQPPRLYAKVLKPREQETLFKVYQCTNGQQTEQDTAVSTHCIVRSHRTARLQSEIPRSLQWHG